MPLAPSYDEPSSLPVHVAIIMDGNGRWAAARGLPRFAGHQRGAEAVREVVEGCNRLGRSISHPVRLLVRKLEAARGRGQ